MFVSHENVSYSDTRVSLKRKIRIKRRETNEVNDAVDKTNRNNV